MKQSRALIVISLIFGCWYLFLGIINDERNRIEKWLPDVARQGNQSRRSEAYFDIHDFGVLTLKLSKRAVDGTREIPRTSEPLLLSNDPNEYQSKEPSLVRYPIQI